MSVTVRLGENTALALLAKQGAETARDAAEGFADDAAASALAVQSVASVVTTEEIALVDMTATGTALGNSNYYCDPQAVRTVARRLTHIKATESGGVSIQVTQTGTTGTVTAYGSPALLTTVAGSWVELSEPLMVPAGAQVWIKRTTVTALKYVAGTIPGGKTQWAVSGGSITTNTAYTTGTTNGVQVEYRYDGEVLAGSEEGTTANAAVGTATTIGFADPIVNTGSTAPANYAVIMPASTKWTHVTGVTVGQAAAGVGTLSVVTLSANAIATIHSQQTVSVAAGVNYIPVAATIPAGAQVVFQSAMRYQLNGGGQGTRYINKALAVGDASTSNPHRMELKIHVASGITGRVGVLESVGQAASALPLRPNDPWISARGYRTIVEQSATALQGQRLLGSVTNYVASNPGAHVAFKTNSRWLDVQGLFNKVVVRDDASLDDFAEVLVDGVSVATWTGSATTQTPKRVVQRVTLGTTTTTREVKVICPYGDGFVLEALAVESTADVSAATAEPSAIIVGVGDSITQGYNTTKPSAGWLWRLGGLRNARILNMGFGGGRAAANVIQDAATAVSADGANATILWVIGVNNALNQTDVAAFKAEIASGITLARAAAPLARIVCVGPFWCPNAESLTIPLDTYRTKMQEAVSESTAGNVSYINGKSAFANDSTDITDGVHPGDTKNAAAATWLHGQL